MPSIYFTTAPRDCNCMERRGVVLRSHLDGEIEHAEGCPAKCTHGHGFAHVGIGIDRNPVVWSSDGETTTDAMIAGDVRHGYNLTFSTRIESAGKLPPIYFTTCPSADADPFNAMLDGIREIERRTGYAPETVVMSPSAYEALAAVLTK